jgi:hypothetical protein
MALLAAFRSGIARRIRTRWWVLLAAATVAGCAVFGAFTPGGSTFAFPHARHIQEGMECGDCHTDWETSDNPGMPALGACKLCHDNLDADKPDSRRVGVLFDGDNFRAARVSKLPADVLFSHQKHAKGGVECKSCHRASTPTPASTAVLRWA